MAKNPVLHLEGAEELNRALREIGGRVGGLLLRKAAEAGAEVIAEEARKNAPRDSGDLAEGIDVVAGQIQQGRAQMNIGVGKHEWYGLFSEFGTVKMPAKPFLRPAFDTKSEEATKRVGDVLREALAGVL
jgi:HK97 gp10 family phage protein